MQRIMLTLLFCSVVTMANNEQNQDNEANGILTKTLTEVKNFKKEKNYEIKLLRTEITQLKRKLNAEKKKQKKGKKEIREVRKQLKISENKGKKEINEVRKKLKISENKILKYKEFETKVNKKLKENKETIKDLHFLMKQKASAPMDQNALGQYYYNL